MNTQIFSLSNTIKLLLCSAFLFMITTPFTFAQSSKDKRITEFIDKVHKELKIIPAISVAIVRPNEKPYCYATGFADIEAKRKATNSTGFYIASSTKPFVGLLACILEEEGKIDFQKPIIEYKPFVDLKEKSKFAGITINDLLSHQVGLDNNYLSVRLAYTGEYTENDILRITDEESIPLENQKEFNYSNYGYYLFSLIIKYELNGDWQDLLQEKIFKPLEMKNTSARVSDFKEKKLAKPHTNTSGEVVEKSDFLKTDKTMHAAGGIITSVDDMTKFLSFQINKGELNDKVIYPNTVIEKNQEQLTSAKHKGIEIFVGNGYARGWRLGDFEGKKVIYHFGAYHGFASHLSFLPNKKIGISININHSLGLYIQDLIASYVYQIELGNIDSAASLEEETIKALKGKIESYKKYLDRHIKKLEERHWELSLPKKKYTGIYQNKNLGTLRIFYQDEKIMYEIGNVKGIATAYDLEESMRIELTPGSGVIIQFEVKDNKVIKFYLQEDVFFKIND